MIIDDDEKDRYILRHRLRGSQVQIMEASNGRDGIAKALADRPDLIFLDLAMPDMSGTEVLSELKADPRTALIAVVVHTSNPPAAEDVKELLAAASAVVSKESLNRDGALTELAQKLGKSGRILAGA